MAAHQDDPESGSGGAGKNPNADGQEKPETPQQRAERARRQRRVLWIAGVLAIVLIGTLYYPIFQRGRSAQTTPAPSDAPSASLPRCRATSPS